MSTNNHTPSGTNSLYLSGGYANADKVGVAKSYKVYPGDVVKIEAYGKYSNLSGTTSGLSTFAAALLGAFGLPAPVGGEVGTPAAAVNTWGGLEAGGFGDGSNNNTDPKAFVNIVIFDKNYNLLDWSYQQMPAAAASAPTYMTASYTVKEAGYAYMYVSNENPTLVDVYYDDVKMTYTPGDVLQYNEYYPFGLQTANSWTRDNTTNKYLYNGKELLDDFALNWLDYGARMFDPAIGRWNAVDPLSEKSRRWSLYNYVMDNPIRNIDPDGMETVTLYGGDARQFLGTMQLRQEQADATHEASNEFFERTSGNHINNPDWSSKLAFKVHQMANQRGVYRAGYEHDRKKIRQLRALNAATVYADKKEFQDGEHSPQHAMSNENLTPGEAAAIADVFVRKQFMIAKDLLSRGRLYAAYFQFGIGLHALQDATSPSHIGFQKWTGEESNLEKIIHGAGELAYAGTNSNLQKVTNAYLEWLETPGVPLPQENLFDSIKADY